MFALGANRTCRIQSDQSWRTAGHTAGGHAGRRFCAPGADGHDYKQIRQWAQQKPVEIRIGWRWLWLNPDLPESEQQINLLCLGHPTSPSQPNSAIPVTSPPPTPWTGFARGRFFTLKSRPQRWHCTVRSEWRDGYHIVTVLRGPSKTFQQLLAVPRLSQIVMIGIGDEVRPGGKPGRPSSNMFTLLHEDGERVCYTATSSKN
jgi:hypothetical protein